MGVWLRICVGERVSVGAYMSVCCGCGCVIVCGCVYVCAGSCCVCVCVTYMKESRYLQGYPAYCRSRAREVHECTISLCTYIFETIAKSGSCRSLAPVATNSLSTDILTF